MARPQHCPCGSKLFPEAVHDGHGIFLFYACEKCFAWKRSPYRDDVFQNYDTEEQIEED